MRQPAPTPSGAYRYQEPDLSQNPDTKLDNRAALLAAHAEDLPGRNTRPEPAPADAEIPENALGGIDLLEAASLTRQHGQAEWD